MSRRPFTALMLTLLATGLAMPASSLALVPTGITVYVDDDGTAGAASCDGGTPTPTSIQMAVDSVGTDSTILVCPGTYVGGVTITGSGHDGLTIRGVSPWTATIKPTSAMGLADNLIDVDDVDRLTFRHLRFLIPATASPCTVLGDVIDVDESRKLKVLSNTIIAKGANTAGCGYSRGLYLEDVTATVSWNIITNPSGVGIDVCGSWGRTRIYRNSVRLFHDAGAGSGTIGQGINVSCNVAPGPYEVLDNVIQALPTAGVTTPRWRRGIDGECCVTRISGNRVSGAWIAIDISAREFDAIIEDNTVVDGDTIDGIGLEISGDESVTVRDNTITGHAKGVSIVDGAGHLVTDNDLVGNSVWDCEDLTSGSGTGGTANTWTSNLAALSNPTAICLTEG